MPVRSTLHRTGSGLGPIEKSVAALARKRLLVGIPGDTAPRPAEPGQKGPPPSNALVGYWMETGVPQKNIPARPFLVPGVQAAMPEIVTGLHKAATAALSGRPGDIDKRFDRAGLAAVASVQQTMLAGGFAPLAQATIEARARRRNPDTGKLSGAAVSKNARAFLKLQAEGTPDAALHDAGLATPLLDTRSLIRSITYAIRSR